MRRECELLYPYPDDNGSRAIYIDKINKDEIVAYIKKSDRNGNRFADFVQLFLNELYNEDLYSKEDINERCQDITAIRFFPGRENDRIYCKEIKSKSRIVTVLGILHLHKTTQKIKGRQIKDIEELASYKYEIK